MKKLKLNQTSFVGGELLSRTQLKKIMGGDGSGTCSEQTGCEYVNCLFNVCMSGWDAHSHTQEENAAKVKACDDYSGTC